MRSYNKTSFLEFLWMCKDVLFLARVVDFFFSFLVSLTAEDITAHITHRSGCGLHAVYEIGLYVLSLLT